MKRLVLSPPEDKFSAFLPRGLLLRGSGENDSLAITVAIGAKSFDELFRIPGASFAALVADPRIWTLAELRNALLSELRERMPWELQESSRRDNYYSIAGSPEELTKEQRRFSARTLRRLQKARKSKPLYLKFDYDGPESQGFRVGLLRALDDERMLVLTEGGYRSFHLNRTTLWNFSKQPPEGFRELVFTLTGRGNVIDLSVKLGYLS